MRTIYQAAYEQFRADRELLELEVPEWNVGDSDEHIPAKIYYYAKPTVGEVLEITREIPDDTNRLHLIWLVSIEALYVMARDEKGKRLWNSVNRQEIFDKLDGARVIEIAGEMGVLSHVAFGDLMAGKPDESSSSDSSVPLRFRSM